MPQQINLFTTLSSSTERRITDRLLFWILGGIVAFLLIITVFQVIWEQKTHYSLVAAKKTYQKMQETFIAVSGKVDNLDIEKISLDIEQKKILLQTLQDRKVTSGKCSYLSNYFASLGASPVPGLWFTQINVDLNKDEVVLSGKTYSALLLVQLVKNLNNTLCFSDREFSPTQIGKTDPKADPKTETESKKDVLNFVMTSKDGVLSAPSMPVPSTGKLT